MLKKIFTVERLSRFILLSLIVSVVFICIRIGLAPSDTLGGEEGVRVKSDYVLMLLQCIVGVIAMLLPGMLKVRSGIIIPSGMMGAYAVFLYCAIFLGEVQSFYYAVPHWDTVLHMFSGGMLGTVGFSVITLLNKTERIPFILSPIFVAVFALCFAMSLGVVWEIYEYVADCILGTNMQKFMLESGELLIGQAALADTMKDLIVDTIGALVVSMVGYGSLKYETGWLEQIRIKVETKPD